MNKKQIYESIMNSVAKEVKKALNESSKSYEEAEAKMDAWHNGTRKQNVKACSDEKLRMNLQICLDKGYTREAKILQNEIDARSNDEIIEGLGITKSKLVKLFEKQNWDFDENGDEVYWDYNGITKTRAILYIQNHDLDDEILDCPDLKFEIEFEFKFDNNRFAGFDILNIDVTNAYEPEIVYIKNFSEVEDFIYSHWFDSIEEILHIMGDIKK